MNEMSGSDFVTALRSGEGVVAAELRPPRAELALGEGMDAWIDTYHAVRRLTRSGNFVCLTDDAVGSEEEDNLRHLVTNLGSDVPRERVVPFLTTKHPLSYCLSYADRAHQSGFRALVVLGGDKLLGPPRCVEHASQLRALLQDRIHPIALGGWANPHASPDQQADLLLSPAFHAEFFLTQIVGHHHLGPVARFIDATTRRGLAIPGVFGVFFYRSANPRTLEMLNGFIPVPAEGLTREFEAGATAEDVCARSIRGLMNVGVRHFYISNLPLARAHLVLADVLERAGIRASAGAARDSV